MRHRRNNNEYSQPYDEGSYDQEPYQEQGQGEYQEGGPDEEQQYEQPGYQEDGGYDEPREPEVVSTSQAVNLTCTLAALSGLFALFLYFADKRSAAVRRITVQSIALTAGFVAVSLALWILGTLFRIIPLLGVLFLVIFWLLFFGLVIAVVFLKVRMMLNAYRGYAYELPLVGRRLRMFE